MHSTLKHVSKKGYLFWFQEQCLERALIILERGINKRSYFDGEMPYGTSANWQSRL